MREFMQWESHSLWLPSVHQDMALFVCVSSPVSPLLSCFPAPRPAITTLPKKKTQTRFLPDEHHKHEPIFTLSELTHFLGDVTGNPLTGLFPELLNIAPLNWASLCWRLRAGVGMCVHHSDWKASPSLMIYVTSNSRHKILTVCQKGQHVKLKKNKPKTDEHNYI